MMSIKLHSTKGVHYLKTKATMLAIPNVVKEIDLNLIFVLVQQGFLQPFVSQCLSFPVLQNQFSGLTGICR